MEDKEKTDTTTRTEPFGQKTIASLLSKQTKDEGKTKHDQHCPPSFASDIASDHDVNEWVLNHLPLTEEQKEKLIQDMVMDHLKKQQSEKQSKVKIRKQFRREREPKSSTRLSVKETSKQT